jgi:hypothetical protein
LIFHPDVMHFLSDHSGSGLAGTRYRLRAYDLNIHNLAGFTVVPHDAVRSTTLSAEVAEAPREIREVEYA